MSREQIQLASFCIIICLANKICFSALFSWNKHDELAYTQQP